MTGFPLYDRAELKGNQLKGFDDANKMHLNGTCIYELQAMFGGMPPSTYANGGLKYITNKLFENHAADQAAKG